MAEHAVDPAGELSQPTATALAVGPEAAPESDTVVDYDEEADVGNMPPDGTPAKKPMSVERLGMVIGLVTVLGLAGLGGWLGYRAHESHQAKEQHDVFLQVGRQGAINLTTIDFAEADTDVQRILNSATGTSYDDFAKRSQPFVDVVKQAQSKSVGTVTAAGVESETSDAAKVLVAVTVKTSNAGNAELEPRAWRMRISVQKTAGEAKVSNVEFVP